MFVKGVYKIPSIRHAFIIVSSLAEFLEQPEMKQEHKKRMEYFEQILRSKDHTLPTVTPQWTLKLMSETDFLAVLRLHTATKKQLAMIPYNYPDDLELLAINLTNADDSSKALNWVSEKDCIELFI